jgi:spermidine synthase
MATLIKSCGDEGYSVPVNQTCAIFLVSVLGLFLEMMLIRWISTEIRIFAYLQNTVLVVCFLGIGLGCFTSKKPINIRELLIPLSFLTLLLAIPTTKNALGQITIMLGSLGDFVIWHNHISNNLWLTLFNVILGLAITILLMILIVNIFIPLGRLLGRLMDNHPRIIWAYSANVAGSLVGTWLFVLLSIFYQPPVIWLTVMGFLLIFFLGGFSTKGKVNLALLIGIIILSCFSGKGSSLKTLWSPYQKLVLKESDSKHGGVGKYVITVNNTGYQAMIDLSDEHTKSHLTDFPVEMRGLSQYDIPLLLHPHPRSFLIVGAGSGNDVAGGLRHGLKAITAVEIDPAIISLGRKYHPEKPYDSPAVHLVNDDARSFFATCKEKYDVISFGLLDSHTTNAMTNARLDHYVYTRESIARAKSLLAPGGVMVLSFEAQKPFIADRMAGVLREVFQEEPLCFRIPFSNNGWGGVIFVSGNLATANKQITDNKRLSKLIGKWQSESPIPLTYTTKLITDDWPYIYLQTSHIPLLFYLLAGMMLILMLRFHKSLELRQLIGSWHRSHWHFFFLGAAFLLLEVQNISKASVVLGNTWEVNAVIVSGVLFMILIANWLAERFPKLPLTALYLALIFSCISLYFLDLSRFAFLPYVTKAIIVGGLTTMPMVFSGIVFIRSFAVAIGKDVALGANLIGAIAGALLQSVTFLIGIKALLLIVAGLYFLSMLIRPREEALQMINNERRICIKTNVCHYSNPDVPGSDDLSINRSPQR